MRRDTDEAIGFVETASSGKPGLGRAVGWVALSAALTGLAAAIGLHLQVDGVALFWPAAGVAAGLALITQGRDRVCALAGVLIALAIGNMTQGRSVPTSAVFMAGNLAEALLFAWLMLRWTKAKARLAEGRPIAALLAAGIVAPILVGLPVAAALRWAGHAHAAYGDVLWVWVSSHALGLIAATPPILLLAEAAAGRPGKERDLPAATLISAALIATLMPMALLAAWGVGGWFEQRRVEEVRHISRSAETLANAVDLELRALLGAVRLAASSPQVRSQGLEGADTRLREVAAQLGGHLVLVDRSYRQLVNTALPPGVAAPVSANPDVYRPAFDTGQPGIGDLVTGTVSGRTGFTVHAPIVAEGGTRHVLVHVPPEDTVLRILRGLSLPQGWASAVLDRNGLRLARSRQHADSYGTPSTPAFFASLTGEAGVVRSVDLEGVPSVTAHHRSALSGWRAVVWTPSAALEAPLRSAQYAIGALVALALAASLGIAWLAGRMLAGPSRRLAATARAVGQGSVPEFPHGLMREANILGAALVGAARKRREAEDALLEAKRFSEGLIATAPTLIYLYDLEERRNLFVGPQIGPMLGYAPEEIAALGDAVVPQVFHPEDLARIGEHHRRIADGMIAAPFTIEYRMRTKDGRWLWLMSRETVHLAAPGGRVKQIIGAAQDITARKDAEAALRESERRLNAVFEALPMGIALVDRDGRSVMANPVYRRFVPEFVPSRDPVRVALWVGRHPDGTPIARSGYPAARALRGERVWPGMEFEYRGDEERGPFWTRIAAVPLTDEEGDALGAAVVITDIDARKRVELALLESEREARASSSEIVSIYDTAPVGLAVLDRELRYRRVNERLAEINGIPAASHLGRTVREIVPDVAEIIETIAEKVFSTGEPMLDVELTGTTPALPGVVRHWVAQWMPLKDDAGEVYGISVVAEEVTERKRREEQVNLLMREVNHRAKNMLGVVQSIARQTAATSPDDFVRRFSERIHALSANQDLLVHSNWTGVDLADLVKAQLAPLQDLVGTRIRVNGPKLRLTPAAAQAIGLALHELSTNACKHGALSNEAGHVTIEWDCDGERFRMSWQESDGPAVSEPTRRGFGVTVLTHMARMSLQGEVALDHAPGGLRWSLSCPVDRALENGEGMAPAFASGPRP